MRKEYKKNILILTGVFCLFFSFLLTEENRKGREVSVESVSEDLLIPGGMPVGIYMETNGVMVLGTDTIQSADGMNYEPADHLIKSGDYILKINQIPVENKKNLMDELKNITKEDVILTIKREKEIIDVKIHPVRCKGDTYKLGIWVRDNTQGLGTVTFLDKNSNYGALGHGVHDINTNKLLEMKNGKIYNTSILDIKKGIAGLPGGMEGIIVYNRYNLLGTITKNTQEGIFGHLDHIDKLFSDQAPVKISKKEKIKKGSAKILCTVDGKIGEYDICIKRIDLSSKEVNKGIVLEVTDQELIEKTGGIVQGMSGSPILQDGKLIGAVTHVLVNDPTRGYGIFIENMLEEAE